MEVSSKRRTTAREKDVKDTMKPKDKKRRALLSNDIILYEILPWVQLKSLYKFKLICKELCRAIPRDPVFKALQSQRCLSLPPGLIPNDHPCIARRYLDDMPNPKPESISLRASKNGLICGFFYSAPGWWYYVSNPITNKIAHISSDHNIRDAGAGDGDWLMNHGAVCRCAKTRMYSSVTEIGFTVAGEHQMQSSCSQDGFPQVFHLIDQCLPEEYCTGKYLEEILWFNIKEDIAGVVDLPGRG